jgi:hypothetical protein
VYDSFSIAAGFSIRQQWVQAFVATLVKIYRIMPILSALAAAVEK